MELPPLYLVRQPLVTDEIPDAGAGLVAALAAAGVAGTIKPGMRVAAASTCGNPRPETFAIARVHSTLVLETLHVTKPLLEAMGGKVEVISGPEPWRFDPSGNLACVPVERQARGCE